MYQGYVGIPHQPGWDQNQFPDYRRLEYIQKMATLGCNIFVGGEARTSSEYRWIMLYNLKRAKIRDIYP